MANSIQQMMQDMHTLIQNAMIATPKGSKPQSIAALEFPGTPVVPEDYDDRGLSEPLVSLLDTGAALDIVHSAKGTHLFALYGQILENAELPPGRELTSDEQIKLNKAQLYIKQNAKTYAKYNARLMEAKGKLARAKDSDERHTAQQTIREIEIEWDGHGRTDYEGYVKTIRRLQRSSPASYFIAAKQTYDEYFADDCVRILPAVWYSTEDEQLSWMEMECAQNSQSSSTASRTTSTDKVLKEYYQKTDFWSKVKGWFGIKSTQEVSTSVQQTVEKTNREFSSCGLSMKWEMMRVSVQRPWLDLGVLAVDGLKLAGVSPGAYSSGQLSWENRGLLPGYITGFIVARNISMDMHVSKDMADVLEDNSHSITCGPFHLGKNCTVEKVQNDSSESRDNIHLRIKVNGGAQMIGYIITPFPRFPTA